MQKILKCIVLSLGVFVHICQPFTSLNQAREYAKSVEEYPDIDNDNWLDPLFDSYQKSLVPNFFSRTLTRLGLQKPLWSAVELQKALIQVTKQRELNGYQGRFVQILEPAIAEKFFIWGDLHGAFHSLVRCLSYLEAQGIIDNSFKIKNSNDYFVFNGNAINQSAFSPETLTLLLNLMAVNPKRVYYLRGVHEDKQAWHDLGLGNALKTRASYVGSEKIPLDTEITKFFNTLPLALYLKGLAGDEKINFVRISPSNRQNNEIDEKKFAGHLENPSKEKNDVHLTFELKPSAKPLFMHAIIKNEDRTKQFTQTNGLALHEPEEDAVSWSVLSAPTGTYRRMFDFFYDAFAVLTIAKTIPDWTISLYNQDVREKLGFQVSKIYKLSSGAVVKEFKAAPTNALDVSQDVAGIGKDVGKLEAAITTMQKEIDKLKGGSTPAQEEVSQAKQEFSPVKVGEKSTTLVTQKMLTFGSTLDLSKGERFSGKQLKAGVSAIFKKTNGDHGVELKALFVDDEYRPEKARENILRFIGQGIDKTVVSMGSPTLEKYLDLVKEKKIAVFFPVTGAPLFRKPDLTNIIHFRKSYSDEAKVAVSYALDKHKSKKLLILYQNDSFGLGALEGPIELAKERGIDYKKEWTLIPYERADLNLVSQSEKIKEINPDAIVFLSVVSITKELIRLLGVPFFEQKKLLALSDFSEKEFSDYVKEKGLRFILMNIVPNPETSTLQIAKEFRDIMKKDSVALDTYAFEAYIAGALLLDAIKSIKGEITNDSLIKYFESMKNINYKGLELNFNPETRELSKYLWINEGDPSWKQYPETSATNEKSAIKSSEQTINTSQVKVKPTEAALTFGNTLDLSKGERFAGIQLKAGISLYLKKLREDGDGIEGIVPKVIFLDDEYTPEKAKENVLRFIKDGIDKTVGSVGTPTLEGYLDLVKDKKVAVFFPATGAPIFRNPELKYIVNLRNSYLQEAKAAVEYVLDVDKAKKIAFFVQNDAYGKGALEGAKFVAKKRNIDFEKEWGFVFYERAEVNLKKQAEAIKAFKPDALVFFSTPTPTKELVRLLDSSYLVDKKLIATSDFGEEVFMKFMQEKGLRVMVMNVVPNPKGTSIEIVNEFREYAQKNNVVPDTNALEGYLSVAVLVDTIKKIKGEITVESIISQFEQIKDYNYKGLILNFNPETRELLKYIWVDTITADWKQMTVGASEALEEEISVKGKREDVPLEEPSVNRKSQPIKTGAKQDKVTESILTFGSTLDLSKGWRFTGMQLKAGMSLYLQKMLEDNETINGMQPRIVFLNDEYTPKKAQRNAEQFLNDGIHKTIGSLGTPTLESYLDLVKQQKIAVFFPATGASMFRTPELRYIVNLRNSYLQETKVLVEYALDTNRAKKIAFLVQNDAYGKAAFEGAQLVAKNRNIDYEKEWKAVYYERAEGDVTQQVSDIHEYDPDALIFLGIPTQAKEVISSLGSSYLAPKKLLGISTFGQAMFKQFLQDKGLRIVVTNVVPNPTSTTVQIVNEFREYAKKNNVEPDTNALEGYLNVAVLVDTIQKIKGEITTESIISQLEQIKGYNYKGLPLNFNKNTRELLNYIWLDTGAPDWQQIAIN